MSLKTVMEDPLELTSGIFKVLSCDTRIDILKALSERKKTATELAEELDLSKSTAHEHLLKLTEACLAKKIASSNKWIYYDLTDKGWELIQPTRKKRIVMLLVSALLVFTGASYQILGYIAAGKRAVLEAGPSQAALPLDFLFSVILISAGVFMFLFEKKISRHLFLKNRI